MLTAKVTRIRKIGRERAVIYLRPSAPFSHHAGQYVELTFPGNEPRPYSIASAPGHQELEIHIRDNGRGGAATYAVTALKEGDEIALRGPLGTALWHEGDRPLLLIAGGMGLSPLKAIAEEALERGHPEQIRLYWGVAVADDLYAKDELDALMARYPNLSVIPVVGRMIGDIVVQQEESLAQYDVYLAGPPPMIEACAPQLIRGGADAERIFSDDTAALANSIGRSS